MKVNAATSDFFLHFPANLLAANLSRNLKNLICQHTSIIRSITVRAGGRVQRPRERGVLGAGEAVGVAEPRQLLSGAGWEDGAVIRPSRWLELSRTA